MFYKHVIINVYVLCREGHDYYAQLIIIIIVIISC